MQTYIEKLKDANRALQEQEMMLQEKKEIAIKRRKDILYFLGLFLIYTLSLLSYWFFRTHPKQSDVFASFLFVLFLIFDVTYLINGSFLKKLSQPSLFKKGIAATSFLKDLALFISLLTLSTKSIPSFIFAPIAFGSTIGLIFPFSLLLILLLLYLFIEFVSTLLS